MTAAAEFKAGDTVLVSDFQGDMETIGIEAIFVGMTEDGKYQTRPLRPGKYKRDTLVWEYCVPSPFRKNLPCLELEHKYQQLIYAVQSKFPGESRHETALRYIRNAESGDDSAQAVGYVAKEE